MPAEGTFRTNVCFEKLPFRTFTLISYGSCEEKLKNGDTAISENRFRFGAPPGLLRKFLGTYNNIHYTLVKGTDKSDVSFINYSLYSSNGKDERNRRKRSLGMFESDAARLECSSCGVATREGEGQAFAERPPQCEPGPLGRALSISERHVAPSESCLKGGRGGVSSAKLRISHFPWISRGSTRVTVGGGNRLERGTRPCRISNGVRGCSAGESAESADAFPRVVHIRRAVTPLFKANEDNECVTGIGSQQESGSSCLTCVVNNCEEERQRPRTGDLGGRQQTGNSVPGIAVIRYINKEIFSLALRDAIFAANSARPSSAWSRRLSPRGKASRLSLTPPHPPPGGTGKARCCVILGDGFGIYESTAAV